MNNWAQLSKAVGFDARHESPTPPTVADIAVALETDDRFSILEWWRYCEFGVLDGEVGRLLRSALHTVARRCEADDEREKHGANTTSLEGSTGCTGGPSEYGMGGVA